MKRRDFITLLGGAAATWPMAARAQQAAMPVVAVLSGGAPDRKVERDHDALRRGIEEFGYADGRNVAVEFYLTDVQRMPSTATVLVGRNVAVIVAVGTPAVRAAKAATTSVPIVFSVGADPVSLGLVASLSRPGGNVTGVTNLNVELERKRLELLAELIPGAATVFFLVNPTSATTEAKLREMEPAVRALGRRLHLLKAGNDAEFEQAFATIAQERNGGLMISSDNFLNSQNTKLAGLAERFGVPGIAPFREFPAGGGLASYGPSAAETWRYVGNYAARILKGEKPADLPVVQSAKFDFVLNFKTAKALGLTVSLPLLGRADEVIE